VTLLDEDGSHPIPKASKTVVAEMLLQHVARMML